MVLQNLAQNNLIFLMHFVFNITYKSINGEVGAQKVINFCLDVSILQTSIHYFTKFCLKQIRLLANCNATVLAIRVILFNES